MSKLIVMSLILAAVVHIALLARPTTLRSVIYIRMKSGGGRSRKLRTKRPANNTIRGAFRNLLDASAYSCFRDTVKNKTVQAEVVKVGLGIISQFPIGVPAHDPENRCINDCVAKKLGMMNEDGTLTDTYFSRSLDNMTDNGVRGRFKHKYQICLGRITNTSNNPCQMTGRFLGCVLDAKFIYGPAWEELTKKLTELRIPIQDKIKERVKRLHSLALDLLNKFRNRNNETDDGQDLPEENDGQTGTEAEETVDSVTTRRSATLPGGKPVPTWPTLAPGVEVTKDPSPPFPLFGWF